MGSKRISDNPSKQYAQDNKDSRISRKATTKTPSLKTLINWNISKALKSDPRIDLRAALRKEHERLEDMESLLSPDAHNLSCALLAWQQLGHRDADSLFNFVQQTLEEESQRKQNAERLRESISCERDNIRYRNLEQKDASRTACQWGGPAKTDFSNSIGLVVKLPSEPQTLMHLSGPVRVSKNINKCCTRSKTAPCAKIDSACCLDAACMEQLVSIDAQTQELRRRADKFARREAERAELLERAEMSWRDLEIGYQRRLRLAKDKEEDLEKQTAKMLEERNKYKGVCMPLVEALKNKSSLAEQEQKKLKQLEQEVCVKACARLQLAEQDARIDAQLTEHQCKASQLDRNLALKEEQEKRNQWSLASEAEAAQVLTHEAEYAQRNELAALRAQVQRASQDLLEEDERNALLKQRIEDYLKEKNDMIEDLEACQTKCDGRMVGLVKDLKSKKAKIDELKNKVMECLCKEPVDRAVEVKRTPSLAALCRCSPSEMLQGTCSCTSVRSRLLSSLLKDLFGGLKSEMENIGSQMPCHLLKCLEDKHNWDRSTDVKTNVRAYFSRLLLGELDIAIATVIEKCHAQWVRECCVDLRKASVHRDSRHSLRWQEHDVEMKAQKMATKLAEKMFLDKAKELAKQAEENLTKDGHPPCECDLNDSPESTKKYTSAVYRCQVHSHPTKLKTFPTIASPENVHRKDKPMAQSTPMGIIKKDVHGTMNINSIMDRNRKKDVNHVKPETTMKNNDNVAKPSAATKKTSNFTTRKLNKSILPKVDNHRVEINAPNKILKGPQQYSVNMCLCDHKNNLSLGKSRESCQIESESPTNHTLSSPLSSLRQSKPILLSFPEKKSIQESGEITSPLCKEKYACFHKTPSNTSVDRLINILTKWKDNLVESQDSYIKKALSTDSLFKITHSSIVNLVQQLAGRTAIKLSRTEIEKSIISENNVKPLQESLKTVDMKDSRTIMSNKIQIQQSQRVEPTKLSEGQNTNSLYCMHTVKGTEMKCVSAEADIQLTLIKSIKNLNNYANNENPVSQEINTKINTVEQLPAMKDLQSCAIHHEDGEKCIQCLGVTLANVNQNENTQQENKSIEDSYSQEEIKSNSNKLNNETKHTNENNIIEIGDITKFPTEKPNEEHRSENYIQFLGVTLDNAKASLVSKQTAKKRKSVRKPHQDELYGDKQRNNHNKFDDKRLNLSANRDLRKPSCAIKQVKAVNVLHARNEFADPHHKVNQLSETKSLEIQNNSNTILSPEPCICCPSLNADSSNNLEVNTFQLLEEHLKCQLEQFKNTSCKSSCIKKVDEKSLFGDTLHKVKKLILESASSVTCKCVGNNQSDSGSWNRAYSLLQEYLKIKIEHVKCMCNSPENGLEENLVPSVLSKISCLINNDLQRLKNLCKCSNTKPDVISKPEPIFTHDPECIGEMKKCNTATISSATDNNYISTSQMVEAMLVSYTNHPSLPYDKSAQVLLRQSVLTKSCDALKPYIKYSEVQTVDIMNTTFIIDGNNTETDYDYCTLSKEDGDEPMKEDKHESNVYSEIQGNDISADITRFQKGDVTVLPIVMPSGNTINESDLKQNTLHDSFSNHESKIGNDNLNDLGNVDKRINEPCLPYFGCTINCSCDSDLGCVCTKSTVPTYDKLNDIWKTFTQKQRVIGNISYILSKISSKILENVNPVDVTDDLHVTDVMQINQCDSEIGAIDEKNIYTNQHRNTDLVKDYYKTEIVQISKNDTSETEVSAIEEKHIYLKKSKHRLDIVSTSATNTLIDDYSFQAISVPLKSKHQGILKRNEFRKYEDSYNIDTTLMSDHACQNSVCCSKDCDCAMVPICHVKMLVENIGNKLVKAECTCDSLKSVCPIHS